MRKSIWRDAALLLLLLLLAGQPRLVPAVKVLCLWGQYFHRGHNVSGACQLQEGPLPPSCITQPLQLTVDGQTLPPQSHTHPGITNFTVPASQASRLLIRCEVTCATAHSSCDVMMEAGSPPSPPPSPECVIPHDSDNIICSWEPDPPATPPASLSLYLTSTRQESPKVMPLQPGSVRVLIDRSAYVSHSNLEVWVSAWNQLGSARSDVVFFNPAHIKKPPPPVFSHSELDGSDLTVLWNMIQDNAVGSMGRRCNLRYRPYMEQNWTEADSELVGEDTFTLQDPRPHTLYLFQVRCAIMEEGVTTVASDWSRPYSARSAEAAPVGALDVWADAGGGEAPALVWKELPPALSHSAALWYEVRQCGADRSSWVGNRTKEAREGCREAADRGGGGSCCRLYLARCPGVTGVMTEVREVSVSAVNRLGRTQPTHLLFENKDLPAPQSVSYTMEKGNLRVSWVPPPDPSEHVQEFVVQRKEAGLNCSRGFDWIRVNATQRSAILTGVFQNYTPYTVSVFALYSSGHSPPASVTSYTLEGVPPAVPGLSVSQISFSKATVAWEPIPLRESRGRVRRYQVGWVEVGGPEDQQQNITVSGQCQAQVSGLAPGRQYQLWVSAETQVGQGPRSHISLTTYERNDLMVMVLCIVGVIIVFAVFLLCKQPRRWPLVSVCCCEKIPDPRNSRLYGVQKDTSLLQEPKPWLWASSSLSESFQKICQLEVIPSPEHTDTGGEERRSTGEGGEEGEWEREREREGGEEEEEDEWGRARKESYSEMKDGEVLVAVGPGAIPPQTPPFFSDYEKHFMPSPLEV